MDGRPLENIMVNKTNLEIGEGDPEKKQRQAICSTIVIAVSLSKKTTWPWSSNH